MLQEVSMKQLLEAGAHFGHQTKRWNPKMRKFIFGSRNGIYIIDLQKTLRKFKEAIQFVTNEVSEGSNILFIGTKKQASEIVSEEARRCGMFYINKRWLGGTLTNFTTIFKSINRLKELESMKESGVFGVLPKKEAVMLGKEAVKLNKFFGGIKDMEGIPSIVFIVDPKKEKIALNESVRVGAKTVAVVDTNCNPDGIDYVIPSNDDAIRAIKLIVSQIADAVLEGKKLLELKNKAKQDDAEKKKVEFQKKDKSKEDGKKKEKEKKDVKKAGEQVKRSLETNKSRSSEAGSSKPTVTTETTGNKDAGGSDGN